MDKKEAIYEAHSSKTKSALLRFADGTEGWYKLDDAVLEVLTNGKLIQKGMNVEATFEEEEDEEKVVFLKPLGKTIQKATGYADTNKRIMRQSAMKMVTELVASGKLPMENKVMCNFAEGLIHYFETGEFETK
jgi:hypothetical protein